jgi:hypothetical protein
MYDSHDDYLHVLWTIYMYKFSRCHVVVFHGFFIPFTDFRQKSAAFRHKPPENRPPVFSKTGRFIGQSSQFISVHSFTIPPSSLVHFSRIFPIFADFYRNFQKPTGSVTSDFRGSIEFLNTGLASFTTHQASPHVAQGRACTKVRRGSSAPF